MSKIGKISYYPLLNTWFDGMHLADENNYIVRTNRPYKVSYKMAKKNYKLLN